jgi:hypothetical protein
VYIKQRQVEMNVNEIRFIENINTYMLDNMLKDARTYEWEYLYPGRDVSNHFIRELMLIELVQRGLHTYMESNGYNSFIETRVNTLVSKSRMNGKEALYHMYKCCAYLSQELSPIRIKALTNSKQVKFEQYKLYAVDQYWAKLWE